MKLILPVMILLICACRTTNKTKSEAFSSIDSTTAIVSDSIGTRSYESVRLTESFTDKKTGFNIRIVYRRADTLKTVRKALKKPLSTKLTPLEWFDIATGQEVESVEISGDVVDNSVSKEIERGTGFDSTQRLSKEKTRVKQVEENSKSNSTSKGFAGAGWLYLVCGLVVVALIIIKKLTS